MQNEQMNKSELLAAIGRSWAALNTALDRLTESQMSTLQDDGGWTVKDHLIHIAYWEKWLVCLLQGQSCCETFGIDRDAYLTKDEDIINEAICQQTRNRSLAAALAEFQDTHQQVLSLLKSLPDDVLQKPCREQSPDDELAGDLTVSTAIIYNTVDHFADHLEWIEALVAND